MRHQQLIGGLRLIFRGGLLHKAFRLFTPPFISVSALKGVVWLVSNLQGH